MMAKHSASEADVLRWGYEAGHFEKRQIIDWADKQLENCDKASDALIDLSLCRQTDPTLVVRCLESLGTNDVRFWIEIRFAFLGIAFATKRISIKQAARSLYAILLEADNESFLDETQRRSIYSIDDGYDLASSGYYGTIEDVESDFIEFVTPYVKRLHDHHGKLVVSAGRDW